MYAGSYVAIVTPLQTDRSIDWLAWDRLVEMHLREGTTGLVIGGTTGESPTLTKGELGHLLVRARALCGKRMQLIAGAGTNSTLSTIERVTWLSGLELDGLLVVTPAYNKPTQEGLYQHFKAVAEAARQPVILYNVPGRTAIDLLPSTVARLARIPGIRGIKEAVAGPERVRQIKALTPVGFDVLSGDDATALLACEAGASGVISVTANVAPRQVAEVMRLARSGEGSPDLIRARQIDGDLAGLHTKLFLESNPIPVKFALSRMGLIENVLRLPLTPLSQEYRLPLEQALQQAHIRIPD